MRCMLCIKPKYKQFRPYVSFHSFPKCPIQKQVWMNICNITNQVDLTKYYSKLANLNNSCILCVKSMIKFKLGSKITLHKFPTCPERRQDWINRCQLTNQEVLPKHKLCSLHFEPTCFKSSEKKRILYQNAVPTIFEVGRYNYKRRVFKGKSKDCVKMEIACQDQ
ncbi:THAP domain-containing protein 2-like isoform X2 [Aphis gossypii]|uniref:THAP domain-containing protein 2-like isoform X2 n=1 Tax=Aphis gossypii TaxID=80765 RepID=UPI002158FD01|nr:THAP domain-containing protein 2-like isoform X2 [Aphis gossypii]